MRKSKKFILYTVGAIILGALIARGYSYVGVWFSIAILGVYSTLGLVDSARVIVNFKKHTLSAQLRLAMVVAITIMTIFAVFTMNIPYFTILAMLAVEYMYRDKNESK